MPTVLGVKANPKARARVPAPLRHYLEDPILVSEWYPEDDYHVLIKILADATPAEAVGGDPWLFFGRITAQRDIAGNQDLVPEQSRVPASGIYRGFGGNDLDVADVFIRGCRLWGIYHDTGSMALYRSAHDDFTVITELSGFFFPYRGVADLLGAYVIEYAHLVGHEIKGGVRHLGTHAKDPTRWEYTCQGTQENRAALARLPTAR